MLAWSLLIPASLATMPYAYELDFRALVAPDTTPGYQFDIAIALKGQPTVLLPIRVGSSARPEQILDGVMTALGTPHWGKKQAGAKLIIYSYDKARVTEVTVIGKGPKPAVRRVWYIPLAKN